MNIPENTQTTQIAQAGPVNDPPILKTLPQLQEKLKLAEAAATVQPQFVIADGMMVGTAARGKVAQWQDAIHILVMRVMGTKPIYLLALSKKDGRTLYDGPVMTEEQRQSIPAEVGEQFELLMAHPEQIKEFGAKKDEVKKQNPEDAKREEAKRAAVDAKAALDIRALSNNAQQEVAPAQRAQAEAERAAAEERMIEMRKRIAADRGADTANKQWQFFRTARATKREKVTYCGISTTEPPPVLIDQLKLSKGIGLVVDFVEPGSPAEAAGLKQYDVITRMDDQVLSNAEQLGVLVRLKKPTDDAKFAVIRQGQPTSINVELGEKEMDVEVENAQADPNAQNRIFAWQANGQLATAPGMMNTMVLDGGGGMAVTNVNGEIQKVWSDDQNVLNLKIKNGKAVTLIAKDKTGKEIFNGTIDTEEQRKALPADLQQKLKAAEEAGTMQYGFRDARVAARARVLTSNDKDILLLARFDKGKATYALALNTTDGKTLFDGPTTTDEERKAVPEAVAKQLETLEKNQGAAPEFGVIGRN